MNQHAPRLCDSRNGLPLPRAPFPRGFVYARENPRNPRSDPINVRAAAASVPVNPRMYPRKTLATLGLLLATLLLAGHRCEGLRARFLLRGRRGGGREQSRGIGHPASAVVLNVSMRPECAPERALRR